MSQALKKRVKQIPYVVSAARFARKLFTPAYCSFRLANARYKVLKHPFWELFAAGNWEPYTREVFQRHIDEHTGYFDLGCWIGPTIFYANEARARSIFAVEANPETFAIVRKNCDLNRRKLSRYKLHHGCIFGKDGEVVSFGVSPGREFDTSCCSIRGEQYQVPTITLSTVFANNAALLGPRNFIKLDIEGGESEIIKDIVGIPQQVKDATVLLSLHPPFWTDIPQSADAMMELYAAYEVLDTAERPLSQNSFYEMMTWGGSESPPWSSYRGNFFEVVLRPRDRETLGKRGS